MITVTDSYGTKNVLQTKFSNADMQKLGLYGVRGINAESVNADTSLPSDMQQELK